MSLLDINVVQVDPSSFTKKRKRTKACVRCHERKVKCDAGKVPDGSPCHNCVVAGEVCRIHIDGRSRANNSTAQRTEVAEDDTWAVSTPEDPSTTASFSTPDSDSMPVDSILSQDATMLPAASSRGSSLSLPTGNATPDADDGELRLAQTVVPRTATANQYQRPQPPAPLDRFESYVHDSLGSYAPSFRPQSERSHSIISRDGLSDSGLSRRFHVDMSSRPTVDLEQQVINLDSADMEYLKAKGAFDLPPRSLQEELINSYFAEVHPTAPVLNRTEFLTEFHNHRTPSRLLLFAIFTSGSRACRNPALLDHRGTNHTSALRFYKAAKALLDTGYEQSKLIRVQALLMITWWWDKKDDGGRNMRSCAVDALNTAQSIGLHRWDHYPKSDPVLLGLWKRIWWTCVNRDVGVAVAHGLPCVLSPSDHDVQALAPEDFNEEPRMPLNLRRCPYTETEINFMIEQTKIVEALRYIHTRYSIHPRLVHDTTGTISEREAAVRRQSYSPGKKAEGSQYQDDYQDPGLALSRRWFDQVPRAVRYSVDEIQEHSFWPAFLHVLYYSNIMLRFREKAVSKSTSTAAQAERRYCLSRGVAAATMISKIMRNVKAHNHVSMFTGQVTNSLFNCLIFFLIEGQSPSDDVRRDAQIKYSLCLNMLYEFSQIWISAALIHRLFEGLQGSMQRSPRRDSLFVSNNPHGSLLPGLRVSSDITEIYMRQLLAQEFRYESTQLDRRTSFGQSTASLDKLTPQSNPFGVDESPGNISAFGAGLPDTLDLNQWMDFFGLSQVDPVRNGLNGVVLPYEPDTH